MQKRAWNALSKHTVRPWGSHSHRGAGCSRVLRGWSLLYHVEVLGIAEVEGDVAKTQEAQADACSQSQGTAYTTTAVGHVSAQQRGDMQREQTTQARTHVPCVGKAKVEESNAAEHTHMHTRQGERKINGSQSRRLLEHLQNDENALADGLEEKPKVSAEHPVNKFDGAHLPNNKQHMCVCVCTWIRKAHRISSACTPTHIHMH